MTLDGWLSVLATVGALVAMAAARVPAERALAIALAALTLLGVIDAPHALSGLSNSGVATVALLFVVAAAVRRSGALEAVVHRTLGFPRSPLGAQLRLMLPVTALSGFLNNTPLVAMLLPEVRRWADERGIAPSYLLMPLSFASILGGMCTLIGTSTNLLVDGLVAERGLGHLGVFWITPLGVPAALVALGVVGLLGRRLLPDRRAIDLPLANPRRFTTEMTVEAGGPLVGQRLGEVVVPGLRAFAPIELRRESETLPAPQADQMLRGGDLLVFAAPTAEILAMKRVIGLAPAQDNASKTRGPTATLVEVVVGQSCPLVGHQVGEGSFRRQYDAAIIAIARDGRRTTPSSLGAWRLEVGDALLLEAERQFIERHRFGGDLVLVSDHGNPAPPARWQAPFSLTVIVLMAAVAASGMTSMFVAALGAAAILVLARIASWEDLATDIEWRVLLAIVCALGLGAALSESGAASVIAKGLVGLGGSSPWAVLAMIYLATVVTTELVTNNAAAVLMLPIGLDTAAALGVSWAPFVAVVMIAASASFMTPIGYQTNLMVYGPGGYRMGDFARFGTPIALAVGAVTLALAPMIWPF